MNKAWMRTLWAHVTLTRVLGSILVASGGLKLWGLLDLAGTTHVLGHFDWLALLVACLESLLGTWLIVDPFPRWSHLAALGCFTGLLNVALAKALAGIGSCGCFGPVALNPWYAVAFDAMAVVALLYVGRHRSFSSRPNLGSRLLTFSSVGLLLATVFVATLARQGLLPQGFGSGLSSAKRQLLSEVVDGIARNQSAYETLTMTVERTIIDRSVKRDETIVGQMPDGGTFRILRSPRVKDVYRYIIRGDEIRREGIEDGLSAGIIDVRSGGRTVEYHPKGKRGWIRHEAEDMGVDPLDPRCLGYRPPMRRLAEWYRNAQVTDVRRKSNGAAADRIEVTSLGLHHRPMTTDHAPEFNLLPVGIITRHDDGSVETAVQLAYRRLEPHDAWVANRIEILLYPRGLAMTPGSPEWTMSTTYVTRGPVVPNSGTGDATFAPVIPADAWVTDATRGSAVTVPPGGLPALAIFPILPPETQGSGTTNWMLAVIDAVVIGLYAFSQAARHQLIPST